MEYLFSKEIKFSLFIGLVNERKYSIIQAEGLLPDWHNNGETAM